MERKSSELTDVLKGEDTKIYDILLLDEGGSSPQERTALSMYGR